MLNFLKKIIRSPLAEILLIGVICLNFFPGIEFWYEMNSVQTNKQKYRAGDNISLFIDYKSHSSNEGYSRIQIFKEGVGEPALIYEEIGYLKHQIPIKVDREGVTQGTPLGWVIGDTDDLHILEPGFYSVVICNRIEVPFFAPRDSCIKSNIFEILPPKEDKVNH